MSDDTFSRISSTILAYSNFGFPETWGLRDSIPKIFATDDYDKVNAIVEQRRQEGARDKDISVSGTASMLLELGLRVYEAQM
ncbi:relaxosome protein TraM, partial [Escherichia coli]|uniref:relaxosome protein TraM n=1 Tax=Escherichia coli TaxID=562 RepID=UPI003EE3BD62